MLYQDAAHAWDDDQVLMLSKRRTSVLTSRPIPVSQYEQVHLSTYVHYTKPGIRTWQKIGAGAAGLAIGSLPYLLDPGNGEGGSRYSNLRKGAPLVGVAVASLPFVLNQRHPRPKKRHQRPKAGNNGWFVPNAYVSYQLYDTSGNLIQSNRRMISREAKESWQKLELTIDIPEDGYLSLELGNLSKQPVWMDGLHYEERQQTIKYTDTNGTYHQITTPIDTTTTDTTTTKPPTKVGSGDGLVASVSGYWRCFEICIGRIQNVSNTSMIDDEEYCWEECEYIPIPTNPSPRPTVPPVSPNPPDGGPGGNPGVPGGNPGGGANGDGGPPASDSFSNRGGPDEVSYYNDECQAMKRLLEVQKNHKKEAVGLLLTNGHMIILPWGENGTYDSETTNVLENEDGNIIYSLYRDETDGIWKVTLADWSEGNAPKMETFEVAAHFHSHPNESQRNVPSDNDKAFAGGFYKGIPEYNIINEGYIVQYDQNGVVNKERNNECK